MSGIVAYDLSGFYVLMEVMHMKQTQLVHKIGK
jgi:hypothetical protein